MTPTLQAQLKPQIKPIFFSEPNPTSQEARINDDDNNATPRVSRVCFDENEEPMSPDGDWNVPLAVRVLRRNFETRQEETRSEKTCDKTKLQSPENPAQKPKLKVTCKQRLFDTRKEELLNFTPETPAKTPKRRGIPTTKRWTRRSPSSLSQTKSPNLDTTIPFEEPGVGDNSLADFDLSSKEETNKNKKLDAIAELEVTPNSPSVKKIGQVKEPKKQCSKTPKCVASPRRRSRRLSSVQSLIRISSVVFSSMHSSEQDTATAIVDSLGGFRIVFSVDETTTHVICQIPRRTMNVLLGLARGCWILSADWLFESLENGSWLPEEKFELKDHFPAADICRKERELEPDSDYHTNLFQDEDLMFIGDKVTVPKKKLKDLIVLCAGRVTLSKRSATIFIGCPTEEDNISEQWVLDSITQRKVLSIQEYKTTVT